MKNAHYTLQLINCNSKKNTEFKQVESLISKIELGLLREMVLPILSEPTTCVKADATVSLHLHSDIGRARVLFSNEFSWSRKDSAFLAYALALHLKGECVCGPRLVDFKYDNGDKAFVVVQQPLFAYLCDQDAVVSKIVRSLTAIANFWSTCNLINSPSSARLGLPLDFKLMGAEKPC